jgi:hypothetical protein
LLDGATSIPIFVGTASSELKPMVVDIDANSISGAGGHQINAEPSTCLR